MNTNETKNQDSTTAYEAPRLEVISLRGDEVLASSCKDSVGPGPAASCQDQFGTCSSIGS